MAYKDNTLTHKTITFPEPGNFNKFLDKLVNIIHNLQLFYSTGTLVREGEPPKCPMCIVYPLKRVPVQQLTPTLDVQYHIAIAIAVKHPNDAVITQQVLDYAEALGKRLAKSFSDIAKEETGGNILLFSDIPGHYNTEIQSSEFGDVKQFSQAVLAYNTGINVVFSVYETL